MYTLYKITNLINNKLYIGITERPIQVRWNEHVADSLNPIYPLHRAIRKYGKDYFTINILLESENRNEISSKEDPTIKLLRTHISQHGYNVAKGGYGGNLGPEANKKRSNTMLARSFEENMLWISKRNVTISGRTKENHSGKLQQSLKMIGNTFASGLVHSAETLKIISDANSRPKSQKTKALMSASAKSNNNSTRFSGRRMSCLCCNKEWDAGNYTQHIRRIK